MAAPIDPRLKRLTPEQADWARARRAEGWSLDRIAPHLGVSVPIVKRHLPPGFAPGGKHWSVRPHGRPGGN